MIHKLNGAYHIENLDDYYKVIGKIAQSKRGNYVYRGQKDVSWPVDSSATRRLREEGRHSRKITINDIISYQRVSLLDPVKLEGWHFKDGEKLCDLEILSELRHFGAATMLIDFTMDPSIALWLACALTDSPNKCGAVYLCDVDDITNFRTVVVEDLKKSLEEVFEKEQGNISQRMFCYHPRRLNQRIMSQRSVFIFGKPEISRKILNMIIICAGSKEKIRQELKSTHSLCETKIYDDFYGFAMANNQYSIREILDYYDLGMKLLQNADYKNAVSYFDKTLELKSGKKCEIYSYRGYAKDEMGDFCGAIEDYDNAINLDSNNVIYHNRGFAKNHKGDFDSAIEDYDKAIDLGLKEAEVYINRGIAKYNQNKFNDAIKDLTRAINLDPDYAGTYNNRGLAKYKQACNSSESIEYKKLIFDSAIRDYNKAIKLYPDYARAYNNRGNAKDELNDSAGAIKDYEKALQLKPDYAEAYINRGEVFKKLDRKEEARKSFETALKLAKDQKNDELISYIEEDLKKLDKNDVS